MKSASASRALHQNELFNIFEFVMRIFSKPFNATPGIAGLRCNSLNFLLECQHYDAQNTVANDNFWLGEYDCSARGSSRPPGCLNTSGPESCRKNNRISITVATAEHTFPEPAVCSHAHEQQACADGERVGTARPQRAGKEQSHKIAGSMPSGESDVVRGVARCLNSVLLHENARF